jgi:hypothetical protein
MSLFQNQIYKIRDKNRMPQTRKQKGKGLLFANGGAQECRIGLLHARYGGSKTQKKQTQKGAGCGCGGTKPPMIALPSNIKPSRELLEGGGCGCGGRNTPSPWKNLTGGYKPTKRNKKYLSLWKKGKSIGFTMRSSLKAKGLIPRANGTYRVSPKYQTHH